MYQRLASYGFAFFLLFICLSISSYQTFAQAGQAELTGEVRDANGAVVAQATVTITQVDTGEVVTATTSKSGIFTVTNLRPGIYTIAVSAPNFRRAVREGLRLTTGERIRVDVALTAGNVNEEVTVSA